MARTVASKAYPMARTAMSTASMRVTGFSGRKAGARGMMPCASAVSTNGAAG